MLDAQRVTMELIGELKGIVERVRSRSSDLADQIQRAATSVALNLAEGRGRTGPDRRRVFRIASAEAQEVKVALEVAAAWGYVDADAIATAVALADRIGAMTYRLAT
ncbi:MAG: four helix bundle protein [Myxococcales bacterium]|nr:four helix bundle protein [Myxococcales bacterium]